MSVILNCWDGYISFYEKFWKEKLGLIKKKITEIFVSDVVVVKTILID